MSAGSRRRGARRSLRQDLCRRHARARAGDARRRARRNVGVARSLGLRQDHHAADHCRARTAGRRRPGAVQRRGRDRHADRAAQCRHGVSVLRAVSQHERRRQYRLQPENPRRRRRRTQGARRRAGGADRNRRPGAPPHRPAVRRPAPARGAGARGGGRGRACCCSTSR